ncbi:MAG: cache domain-containing protein [Candidatus Scalindua rubra]|uniref:Two-component sensor kinase n=1 Tax=Candidatus Scalindua brodae TaxID=237368 RepID=A0A0B0ESB2_9BACT|nr:MAG: two-component sensor kinase [Candidatus Scalindua brodae]MBZ0110522.1 cache domain-containing protein [Candidatus Scalindua rubra]TWU30761.1 hypothetical protein S225a_24180 [Candidatus Brocadiaceae bacterium S225]
MKRLLKESIVIITVTLIFFALFPLILFRVVAFPHAKSELKQHVKTNLEETLLKQKNLLTFFLEERRSHARSISDSIRSTELIYDNKDFVSIIKGGNEHEYLRLKTQLECAKTDYDYKGIFVCDATGKIHMTTTDEKSFMNIDIEKEDIFKNVRETLYDGKSYISSITHFSINNIQRHMPSQQYIPWQSVPNAPNIITARGQHAEAPSLFISYPIKKKDHRVAGAVILWMDMSKLNDVMKNFALGKTGETYLVNKDGIMVTESRFSRHHMKGTGNTCRTCHVVEDPDINMLTKGVEACVTKKRTGNNLDGYHDYGGINVVGAWSWLKDLDMGLMVELDVDEAFVTVNNINTMIKSLMFVIIIPAIVIASLIHRKISLGYMIKNMALPKKTLIGAAVIVTVGSLIAILDGYQLNKQLGYGREQQYKVPNPFSVFGEIGAINTGKGERFIEENIQEFKKEYRKLKSEIIPQPENREEAFVKREDFHLEKQLTMWD